MPEYNQHGDALAIYWPRLTEERPDFQAVQAMTGLARRAGLER